MPDSHASKLHGKDFVAYTTFGPVTCRPVWGKQHVLLFMIAEAFSAIMPSRRAWHLLKR
jgi:hypothetical protein